jgi:outer membrane protein assembly factor BamB
VPRRFLVLTFLLLLVSSRPGSSQEWTRFRGPNGSGIGAAEFPAAWTEADFNWKTPLPGIGHSCPVVWGQTVFLMSAEPDTALQYVLGIDQQDGSIRWQREFLIDAYHIHARNSFASVTPAVDADHVYVVWATPDQVTASALDHQGNTVWQQTLGAFASQHGFGASPIVQGDRVIVSIMEMKPEGASDQPETSRIVALDRMTGEVKWVAPRRSEVVSYSVPCVYEPTAGPPQLISCSTSHGIFSLNPQTGDLNWERGVFSMRTVSSPIIAHDLILGTTGSGGGGNYVVALQAGEQPEIAYEVRKQAPYVPTPVAWGSYVFLWSDKGIVTCIRASDGEQVWQERVGGNYSGSPVVISGRLLCIDEEGMVVVLAADVRFQLLGKNMLGEASRSTPAAANGQLLLRTYSHLFSIGNSDKDK